MTIMTVTILIIIAIVCATAGACVALLLVMGRKSDADSHTHECAQCIEYVKVLQDTLKITGEEKQALEETVQKMTDEALLDENATKLTNIAFEHLSTLPPSERKRRLSAFHEAVSAKCADPDCPEHGKMWGEKLDEVGR